MRVSLTLLSDIQTQSNHACGEDSDCINRATKMECPGDCGCGDGCQNQRFQRRTFADVSVFKTDKKGFGLRANKNLNSNVFIFEYIGEVISEPAFRRRMHQYDQEGIKHFYFMSLNKGEFVDATKKGNLGRFCNHSCNPNCYVDKWVVGDRLRMGIFTERKIEAGEELTFNYNVDRYGADPQPCYCGEPNCSGYIGGKTQTDDRAVQLSSDVQIALGIKDNEDWENAVHSKKPRKKKASEDDEEYVDSIELKQLSHSDVRKVMGELYKNQEKWIIVKLLGRIQNCEDDRVRWEVAKFHGYNAFNKLLKNHADDVNILLQVLDILNKIPRLTRNKIVDSKIDVTVGGLLDHEDERVKLEANRIHAEWAKLEMGYRIPRVKRDPNAVQQEKRLDRPERKNRERSRSRSRSRSVDAPKGPSSKNAPSGPRGGPAHRGGFYQSGNRPFRNRQPPGELAPGWFEAVAQNGSRYYYNAAGQTTWQRPTQPTSNVPPPSAPKVPNNQQALDDLIQDIVNQKETPRADKVSATTTPVETPLKATSDEKWRSLPEEKQKKIYENTVRDESIFTIFHVVLTASQVSTVVIHVAAKYKGKLDKSDIKRFSKECSKKLVNSDFKNNRVKDPLKLDSKQERNIKKYVTDFFNKVVVKKTDHDKREAEKTAQGGAAATDMPALGTPQVDTVSPLPDATFSPSTLKRRRDEEIAVMEVANEDDPSGKKARISAVPLPPPPPAEDPDEEAVRGGSEDFSHTEGFSIKGAAAGLNRQASKYGESPMQTATPPTTNSPDEDERERRRREYSGVNAQRMRQLGLMDGASDS